MAKLRVTIEIDEEGQCRADMTFRKQEIEAEGSTPSEALQNLSETLALYEIEDENPLPEDAMRGQIYAEYA